MTGERSSPWIGPRAIIGLLIVVFGLALTLENLHVWPGVRLWRFWPLVLVGVGAIKLANDPARSGRTTGAILLFVGMLFSIEHFVWPHMNVWRWWPLAIVLVGLTIILRAVRGGGDRAPWERVPGAAETPGSRTEPTLSEVAIWSGIERRISSPNFRRADLTAIMGGIELDLRQAGTDSAPAVIDLFVMMGGVEITVPPDWAVSNQISAFMGGVEDKSTGTQQARHRLVITGVAIMGGVEIKT